MDWPYPELGENECVLTQNLQGAYNLEVGQELKLYSINHKALWVSTATIYNKFVKSESDPEVNYNSFSYNDSGHDVRRGWHNHAFFNGNADCISTWRRNKLKNGRPCALGVLRNIRGFTFVSELLAYCELGWLNIKTQLAQNSRMFIEDIPVFAVNPDSFTDENI